MIDDDETLVSVTERALQSLGYSTLAFRSAESFQATFATAPSGIDLLVTDQTMPGMTGFELLDAIRTDARTRSLPILVVTAKDLTRAERRELNGRVAAVLSRASDPNDLLKLLGTLVPQPAALAAS